MHTSVDPSLAVRDRALVAVARTRALGMHFYGHFLGIGAPGGAGERLVLDPQTSPGTGCAGSPGELASLADLAMGSAVRSALGAGLRLGTTSLSLHHLREPAPGRLTATARVLWSTGDPGDGHTHCTVEDSGGQPVLAAHGWFVVLPSPDGRVLAPLPWESDADVALPVLVPDDLDAQEREAVAEVQSLETQARARTCSVAALLTEPRALEEREDGALCGVVPVTRAVGNRVGHVQGGALYGIAAAAAEAVMGPEWALSDGYAQYLRPADGREMGVQARSLRRGRRAGFTEVTLSVREKAVVTARFTHRPAAASGIRMPEGS
ncbi:MAG: acyl-CoA thioesterase domain-containing protein [Actinomycetes bacterium]